MAAGRRIVIIQGHPDLHGGHLGHALAAAYRQGAEEAGHEVRSIEVAAIDFPLLHSREDWARAAPPETIRRAQDAIGWAGHLVVFYPLWLGTMPALLKAFLEQVFRPGFAITLDESGGKWKRLLSGKSARVVVTMGMPAFFYRWYFRAHSLKSLERNILRFCGIGPIRESLFGMVEGASDARRAKWLAQMRALGREGQ